MGTVMMHKKPLRIFGKDYQNISYGNFLAVHSKLRGKKFANILLKEIYRTGITNNIYSALTSTAEPLPTPFVSIKSALRFIDVNKLIDIRYTSLP